MTCSRCSGWVLGAVAGLMLAAALCCPGEAWATSYAGPQYFAISVDGAQISIVPASDVASPTMPSTFSLTIYYDWDFDGSWINNLADADDYSPYPGDYDQRKIYSAIDTRTGWVLPLNPLYQVYYVSVTYTSGSDTFSTRSVVVNDRAEVVIANDEPTPVRIQEIGLASEASTLGPDILPTSLDASVSVDGTLPVDVVSFLHEDDTMWYVVGGLCGIGSFLALDRLAVSHV